MIKLIIDSEQADLTDGVIIALTKQSNDIFDFNNKRSNLSNTIKLPKSDANNTIFGQANDLASTGVTRNWFSVKLIQDYEEIISEGKGKLIGSEGNFYSFTIYWGNIDLSARIGEKTLRDLELEDLRHVWNTAAAIALSQDSGDVVYPVLNTHETEEKRSGADGSNYLYANRMIPFVALSRILNQIATDNDLTFEGIDEFLTPTIVNDYYIPVSRNKYLDVDNVNQLIESNRLLSTNIRNPFIFTNHEYTGSFLVEEITILETGTYEYYLSAINRFVFDTTSAAGSIQTNINILIAVDVYDSVLGVWHNPTFTEALAGVPIDYNTEQFNNTETITGTGTTTIGINTEYTLRKYFTAGDKIRFNILSDIYIESSGTSFTAFQVKQYIQENTEITFIPQMVVYNDMFPLSPTLPDIKQLDILKFVAAITNSLVDIEDGTNNVIFTKFEDVVNSVITTQDYSDKVEKVKIKSYHPKLSQNNYLNYDNDEDVNESLAQGNVQITDNNSLLLESELYKAPFSASNNEFWLYAGDTNTEIGRYPIIKVWNAAFNSIKARIFKLKLVDESIYIGTGTASGVATSKYVAAFENSQHFSDLGYLDNYEDYTSVMSNYKACEVLANMTGTDFKAINLYKSLYIEQEGAYFFILSVNDFIQGKKTKLSLLKL